jgi:hypothetical protein
MGSVYTGKKTVIKKYPNFGFEVYINIFGIVKYREGSKKHLDDPVR